ncbi:MFS transporter [Asticcacaulis sp. AC466]|uniref:MFS transporter n=1 Tax=Asticcacaulis sp. AC466 TaxID=1282362 RepID=UPI00041A3F00|nr:MFS transporter [Asticcacaulis sp. AC466]
MQPAETVSSLEANVAKSAPAQQGTLMRQAVFYALLCAGTGASLPFIPLWLGYKGMSAGQIGWILAIPLIGRAITGPLSGVWADRFKKYRTPIMYLGLLSVLSYGLMGLGAGTNQTRFMLYMALYGLGYTGISSITPLLDAMTLQLSRSERFAFSTARAAGSASFIFANICLGYLLQTAGINAVLVWTVISASTVAVGARFILPSHFRLDPTLTPSDQFVPRVRLATLVRNRDFILVMAAVGCLQAAHSFYYAFSTIIWEKAGHSSTVCGLLWAVAVLGELLFLGLGGPLRRRLGPWRLLILGAVAGVVRWTLLANVSELWLLWPLQLLHSLSFVAVYLAGLELIFQIVPAGYEGLAQSINSAYASGVMTGICTLLSGMYFDHLGAGGYYLMAALAGIGLIVSIWLFCRRKQRMLDISRTGI